MPVNMLKALDDPDRNVRIAALAPVASHGAKAIDAVPILLKWIGSEDEFSHVSAAGHILMIDPSRADELLPKLVEGLESDDFGIRCQTAWLLGRLGKLAGEAPSPEAKQTDLAKTSIERSPTTVKVVVPDPSPKVVKSPPVAKSPDQSIQVMGSGNLVVLGDVHIHHQEHLHIHEPPKPVPVKVDVRVELGDRISERERRRRMVDRRIAQFFPHYRN